MGNLSHRYFNNKISDFCAQIFGQKVLIIEGNDSIEFSHINFENTTFIGVTNNVSGNSSHRKAPFKLD